MRKIKLGVVAAAVAIACGGDGGSEPPAVTISAVILTPPSLTIEEGATGTASAAVSLSNGQTQANPTITWASDNAAIATVSAAGTTATITGVAAGQATVRASSGAVSATLNVAVTPPAVSRVTVTLSGATVVLGATSQARAALADSRGRPITGRAITWTSTSPASASVNSSGLVTGVSKGTSYIKASVEGRADSALITVFGVAGVAASPDTLTLPMRGTATATAVVTADPGIATGVQWSSSQTAVATVSAAGEITAVTPGNAVVRAVAVADPTKRDSVLVTVFNACAVPATHTLGTVVSGTITLLDCGGLSDEFAVTLAAATYYRLTVSADFPGIISPSNAVQVASSFPRNVAFSAYAFVPAGSTRISLASSDTSVGRASRLTVAQFKGPVLS